MLVAASLAAAAAAPPPPLSTSAVASSASSPSTKWTRGAHEATREAAEASPWALRASFARGFEEGNHGGVGMPIRLCFGFVAAAIVAAAAASATTLAFPPNLAMLLKAIRCSL